MLEGICCTQHLLTVGKETLSHVFVLIEVSQQDENLPSSIFRVKFQALRLKEVRLLGQGYGASKWKEMKLGLLFLPPNTLGSTKFHFTIFLIGNPVNKKIFCSSCYALSTGIDWCQES